MSGLQLYQYLVPRALFPGFGGGLPPPPWGQGWLYQSRCLDKIIFTRVMLRFKKITFSFPICTSHSLRSWSVIVLPAQIILRHIYLSWSKSVRIHIFMLIISGEKNFFWLLPPPPPHFSNGPSLIFCRRFYYCYEIIMNFIPFYLPRRLAWWHPYCKTRNFLIKVE